MSHILTATQTITGYTSFDSNEGIQQFCVVSGNDTEEVLRSGDNIAITATDLDNTPNCFNGILIPASDDDHPSALQLLLDNKATLASALMKQLFVAGNQITVIRHQAPHP